MRIWTLLTITTITIGLGAQTVVPVGPFDSVELHDGGHVVVRPGATRRVTILRDDAGAARIAVRGQRLVIHNAPGKHRRHERLEIEVVIPELAAVSVSNGGTVQTAGAFAARPAIAASVAQGGTIDIRSVAADAVVAAVDSGGRIFTSPRHTLTASVRSGGVITYWGTPHVTRSVRDGGVVVKGAPGKADRPLSELDPGLPVIPRVPPAIVTPR
ncbi:MAG TPA: DUF2807 domain-containing protein [Thermoanaerobaculia bacterium]|nr:DUF2807 domain-containing protein [Thermoanaerobaculia bacterium]